MLNKGDNQMTDYAVMEKLDEIHHLLKRKVRDRWLNLQDVCAYSSLSESTIRRAVRVERLKASRQTGKLLFRTSWVDRWLSG